MAAGFIQYFFRWISGGAGRTVGTFRCVYAAGSAVGVALSHGAEPCEFSAAEAAGPLSSQGAPL